MQVVPLAREYEENPSELEHLWVLEKNKKAIDFYKSRGFHLTTERKINDGTPEYVVKMRR